MTVRVAVCVSGAYHKPGKHGTARLCNAITKLKFPGADFYYATWDQFRPAFEKDFPQEHCEYFPEPKMHYHPYKDIPESHHTCADYRNTMMFMKASSRIGWSRHHTKQLLIHTWLSDKIKDKYDVIVRVRFDLYLHQGADFAPYIQDTYENNRSNCFAATKAHLYDRCRGAEDHGKESIESYKTYMLDHVIIYPADAIDADNVMRLHKEKKLHAAEYGWYQIIGLPHNAKHRCYCGWASSIEKVENRFRWDDLVGNYDPNCA